LPSGGARYSIDNEEEALQAIANIGQFDRRRVRAEFESRFTARRMASEYIKHYMAFIGKRAHHTMTVAALSASASN